MKLHGEWLITSKLIRFAKYWYFLFVGFRMQCPECTNESGSPFILTDSSVAFRGVCFHHFWKLRHLRFRTTHQVHPCEHMWATKRTTCRVVFKHEEKIIHSRFPMMPIRQHWENVHSWKPWSFSGVSCQSPTPCVTVTLGPRKELEIQKMLGNKMSWLGRNRSDFFFCSCEVWVQTTARRSFLYTIHLYLYTVIYVYIYYIHVGFLITYTWFFKFAQSTFRTRVL